MKQEDGKKAGAGMSDKSPLPLELRDIKIIFCIAVIMILLTGGLLYAGIVEELHQQRIDAYVYCLETEMGEGHSTEYDAIVWHEPNLKERYSRATQYCNVWYYQAYGIEIWEDS